MAIQTDERSIWLKLGPMVMATMISMAILSSVCVIILNNTSERLLLKEAEHDAIAWANYVNTSITNIEAIANGEKPDALAQNYLINTQKYGEIFNMKIFNRLGQLRLTADYMRAQPIVTGSDTDRDPNAVRVIATGITYTEIHSGTNSPGSPLVYVESYVPIIRNGTIVGVSEIYVDKTNTSTLIKENFVVFGFIIAGLTLLVLLVPMWSLRLLAQELKARNHDLNQERARAVDAENAKSTFLAHMSHELRTPLNAIHGLSEMMVRGDLGPMVHAKYYEYSKDIHDSAIHLLKLVNDILDLSKIDAGKFELDETRVDISEEIQSALRIVSAWSIAENLKISSDVADRSFYAWADKRAIKQILLNLLSNAVKFTPTGGTIKVRVQLDDQGNCVISVKDTGYGIAGAHLDKITEPFNQLRRPANLHQEGTGLGLSLVKSMIELHGGTLEIESQENVGTLVTVMIPASRMEHEIPAA